MSETATTSAVAPSGVTSSVPATTAATAPETKGSSPFKRTLTVKDMVIWGLICMVPISPMAIYGGVFTDSGGMACLAFIIGFVAVLFSVFSFTIMIQRFPSSGSIFTYVSNVMGKGMGFIAGWLMLLQYLVAPTLVYLIAAIAIHSMVPQIPVLVWCFAFLVVVSAVSLIGMKTAVMVNRIALLAQLVILALFVGFGIAYIVSHPETSAFSLDSFYNPSKFDFGSTMTAVSLAMFSFVGFGAIATLTQEAVDPKHGPSRAMLIMVVVLCLLYLAQIYIACCIDPSGSAFVGDTDNAFYNVARMITGPWLSILCALGVALAQGVFTAIAQQTSIAFVMFTMARGGALPKFMGKMNQRTNSPMNAIIFIIALSVVLLLVFHFAGIDMNTIAKINNFGAMASYGLLNLSVLIYCWFQLKERKGLKSVIMHLIFPVLGTVICFGVMFSVQEVALIVGFAWVAIGAIYYLVITRALHREIKLA
ncbi:MAG: APC family permease [Eggerthellaceae bacterium]|nr:APC family permease [Eggerthellaceae bacterium]